MSNRYKNNLECINPYNYWYLDDRIEFRLEKIYNKQFRLKYVNDLCQNLIYFGQNTDHINIDKISILQPQYPETFFESWILYYQIQPKHNCLLLTNNMSLGNIESMKIYSELNKIDLELFSNEINEILYQTIDYKLYTNENLDFIFMDFIEYSNTKTIWKSQNNSLLKYINSIETYLPHLDKFGKLIIKYSFLSSDIWEQLFDILNSHFSSFSAIKPENMEPDCPYIYILCSSSNNKYSNIKILVEQEYNKFIEKKNDIVNIDYNLFVHKYNLLVKRNLLNNTIYNEGYLNYLKRFIDTKPCFLDQTINKNKYISWEIFIKNIEPLSKLKYVVKNITNNIVSNAWLKMYELLSTYDIIPNNKKLDVLHLCEAPGTFVTCFNHYICTKTSSSYNWTANTLPYQDKNSLKDVYGLIKKYKNKWVFADVTKPDYILDSSVKYDIITGDGGIHCPSNQYSNQENITSKLIFMEFMNIIFKLKKNGNAVLKMYLPCSNKSNKTIIYLASKMFKYFELSKPETSNKTNSEFYLVMLDFNGISTNSHSDFINIINNFDNLDYYIPGFYSNYKIIHPKIRAIDVLMKSLIDNFCDTICEYLVYTGKNNYNNEKISEWLYKYKVESLSEHTFI